RYLLSPLAGYTNLPFRLPLRELGGLGLATTDLVNARALLRASRKTLELIETCPADRPLAVQIYGADAAEMADAARWLHAYGADAEGMRAVTGCACVSVGRGALLNPWLFAQLQRWEQTGDAGPAAGYDERLTFMARHFHLLVGQRGEHFACLTFRKVANWYCRVLRPGREVQQTLIRLESVAVFEDIVARLREAGPPGPWEYGQVDGPPISVPSGPVERW